MDEILFVKAASGIPGLLFLDPDGGVSGSDRIVCLLNLGARIQKTINNEINEIRAKKMEVVW